MHARAATADDRVRPSEGVGDLAEQSRLLGGSRDLELRWEMFNLLNKANFDIPNRIFGTPNFGRVFSAKEPREMQFGVKLAF